MCNSTSPPVMAAPQSKVPATIRSGMMVCSAVLFAVVPPRTRMLEVPAPVTSQPRALRKLCRSSVSGSRAALRI